MSAVCRPESRSKVAVKLNQIGCLLIRCWSGEGNSREEDASILRECARLCMSAAEDLDPRGEWDGR